MAISAAAHWRVRIGGSDTLCAGVFDSSVVGAGTDYTEQDVAQLALTDLAATTPYTTVTSATGGFTAAMIGNGIRIASGTGFTAGRYIVTGVTNGNTAILDRACATAAASGGVMYLGGALASVITASTSSTGMVAGNVVYIRGQGSNEPIDIDYYTAATVNAPGGVSYIGYNGRPKIGHNGGLWSQPYRSSFENMYFVQTVGTNLATGVVNCTSFGAGSLVYNCVFDSSGFDSISAFNISCLQCSFINSGGKTPGTSARSAWYVWDAAPGYGVTLRNCLIKDQRFRGVVVQDRRSVISGNIIQGCLGDGINVVASAGATGVGIILNNTIYDCGGDGISVPDGESPVFDNIISGIVGAGAFGINVRDGIVRANTATTTRVSANIFHNCTTNCNAPLSPDALVINPQFANAPIDLTPTNPALRTIGGVGAL